MGNEGLIYGAAPVRKRWIGRKDDFRAAPFTVWGSFIAKAFGLGIKLR